MIKDTNNIIVYHASYAAIEDIDLSFSKPNKDFGQGFYVTTDYEQAKKFAFIISKRRKTTTAYINSYLLTDINGLDVTAFKDADGEWLKCVSGFRNTIKNNNTKKYEKKDIIIGKVADDNTNLVINAYIRGAFGELDDKKVTEVVVDRLMTEKLIDQICFKTKRSLKKLKFMKAEALNYAKK